MELLTLKTHTIFIFLFSLLHLKLQAQKMEHFNTVYASFDETFFNTFEVEKPATISNSALQVTPDSASSDFNLNNNSGRILFKKPFKLWDGDVLDNKTRVASFNSSFLVNIYRPNNETAAEGLTFLISPDLEKPLNSQGWCHKNGKLLLVYEYMPNGSLDMHLFAGPDKEPLSWQVRYKIVQGVASALHYLHNEYEQRVVHRDLKASNIMLDSKFNARLGDFGLARALDNERTSYAEAEGVLGTMGYIAPECFHTGKATQQSDVYAFGAVLLEVVCGQRPGTKINGFQFFVDWVWYLHRDGRILEAVDQRLGDNYVADEAKKLLLLGLACAHPIATDRPKTQTIVQIISGSAPAPEVPPFKPAFVWPSMVPIDIDSSVMDTTSITTSHFNSGWSLDYQSRETPSYADRSLV